MADSTQNFFPKLYGYTPKMSNQKRIEGSTTVENRLDKFNPGEFRKGMDYELTSIGCSRLAESTAEEREKATETVLKNLEEHGGYYTALLTYESLFKNPSEGITKPSFKSWLDEQDDAKMKPVIDDKFNKIKDSGHKNDKMIELKEAIKNELKHILLEKKGEEEEGEKEPKAKDLKAIEKEMGRFEAEAFAIEKLLFNGKDGDREDEFTKDNPAPDTFFAIKKQLFDDYKEKGWTGEEYREKSEEALKTLEKQLEDHVKEFGAEGKGNKVTIGDLVKSATKRADGKTQTGFNATINALEQRVKAIENEKGEEATQIRDEKMEVAYQDMSRQQHIKLLEICQKHGVNLREGAMGIKQYYEIAKEAYLEGLTNGLRL